ncbi:SRPBCC family protein [Cohnella silvisoli]|uniref:SRPBCC family protein n=2 Tax=Cohnella silvisoli TaxID=2873699 RepID=A0ABV1L2B6_9BACL|nr:SRPBCC family protein [Cohnella silvisoli]
MSSPRTIYKAFVDPKALVSWLPPKGMIGHIYEFDARNGGAYRMSLTYVGTDHSTIGKTSEHADVVQGRFLELVPDERVVQLVEFESEDPAFAGTMTMTWSLAAVPEGTEVTIVCENVPEGIRQDDHAAGLSSSLENLAAFTE